jgi:prephenate dehydratase
MGLKRSCLKVRYLGSYPRAGAVAEATARGPLPGASDAEFVAAAEWVARCQDGRFPV